MEFNELEAFEKKAPNLLNDSEYAELQCRLAIRPEEGKVIPGSGGARKIRVALQGRGKSGGARVIYYFAISGSMIWLIDIFAKNEKENLTGAQLKALERITHIIKEHLI